jgi:hypothetical protein
MLYKSRSFWNTQKQFSKIRAYHARYSEAVRYGRFASSKLCLHPCQPIFDRAFIDPPTKPKGMPEQSAVEVNISPNYTNFPFLFTK